MRVFLPKIKVLFKPRRKAFRRQNAAGTPAKLIERRGRIRHRVRARWNIEGNGRRWGVGQADFCNRHGRVALRARAKPRACVVNRDIAGRKNLAGCAARKPCKIRVLQRNFVRGAGAVRRARRNCRCLSRLGGRAGQNRLLRRRSRFCQKIRPRHSACGPKNRFGFDRPRAGNQRRAILVERVRLPSKRRTCRMVFFRALSDSRALARTISRARRFGARAPRLRRSFR